MAGLKFTVQTERNGIIFNLNEVSPLKTLRSVDVERVHKGSMSWVLALRQIDIAQSQRESKLRTRLNLAVCSGRFCCRFPSGFIYLTIVADSDSGQPRTCHLPATRLPWTN